MNYKAILFDFDGTLADTAPGIVATMRATFAELGMPIPEEPAMRATIGIPLPKALQMLNSLSDSDADLATQTYRRLFATCEAGLISIFPGVAHTLKRLQQMGVRMAIVTSRNAESLDLLLRRHGLDGYFEMRVTNNDGLAPKPAPDMVEHLLSRMGLNREETLVVGDTTYDILMGNSAGCRTCAVTYGNHPVATLQAAHPAYLIDQFPQLLAL